MKIGVLSRHSGMDDYFRDVLEDHELTFYNIGNNDKPTEQDVYVVGLPVKDISEVTKFGKPIISYPCLWDYALNSQNGGKEAIKDGLDRGLLTMVMNDNVWSPKLREVFPDIQTEYISYAFKGLPQWTGKDEKVLVAVRVPDRLRAHTDKSLQDILGGIPYELHQFTEREELLQRMADCRVMFYFSNSPWTLVFCEALSVGIPIVTFNKFPTGDYANVSGDVGVIQKALRELLEKPNRAYSERNLRLADRIMNFEQAKQDWNNLLKRV